MRLSGALVLASLAVTAVRFQTRLPQRSRPLADGPLFAQNGRVLQQFTASQDAQLQTLQQQAAAAQSQAAQAAAQLDNAQTQVAEASDQLQAQNTQVSSLNAATQSNVQELSVLLPTTPAGAPAPGPEAAQGASPFVALPPRTAHPAVARPAATPRRTLVGAISGDGRQDVPRAAPWTAISSDTA